MTYEHGRADADAPVTWQHLPGHEGFAMVSVSFAYVLSMRVDTAEYICRAFHLAKLAEEAAGVIANAHATTVGAIDWLRRYRAAKGEA